MRSCPSASGVEGAFVVPWLSLCEGCSHLSPYRSANPLYLNLHELRTHVGKEEFDALRVLSYRKVSQPPLSNCKVSGVFKAAPDRAFIWRPVDMRSPALANIAGLLSGSEIKLREVAIPIIDALQMKFDTCLEEGVKLDATNSAAYGLTLSLHDVDRALDAAAAAAADGNTAEGNTAEGNTAEGNTAEGNTAEGNAAEGNAAEGNAAEGNTAAKAPAPGARAGYDWDGSELFGHGFVLTREPKYDVWQMLKHEYRAYAVGLVLLALCSNVADCTDSDTFKTIVCNFLGKLETRIRHCNGIGRTFIRESHMTREAERRRTVEIGSSWKEKIPISYYLCELKYMMKANSLINYIAGRDRHFERQYSTMIGIDDYPEW
ncbi:hypothetical protein GNI_092890 [Gregarina niphandrodes]|uniref:Uncharacterized protein n=1 Tax=Gregarina niphandrodes TaxID=110365 RepID=A0A023B5E4_GRENI|nr:hypothetical protein GNI_092890 [Gregarina niphandrodes]EZG59145.1 hypothetical protein GNI_092890 [Gregarina niphandrodes]|eukprot:XP_011130905.1 hypothetical protein GNI_092890 [Gregarina niphandrodes]